MIAELPAINATLPEGMQIELVYDSTETISASIEEVFKTIGEAVAIVVSSSCSSSARSARC